ncbi:hypothetical protein [Rubritalea tangerina]|uniref:hypothetical protein n=1 Tax=Rubritalea tangerina TaxID=430798 RepID=UPI0036110A73
MRPNVALEKLSNVGGLFESGHGIAHAGVEFLALGAMLEEVVSELDFIGSKMVMEEEPPKAK